MSGADEGSHASGAALARVLAAWLPRLRLAQVLKEIQSTAHPGARAIARYGLFLVLSQCHRR